VLGERQDGAVHAAGGDDAIALLHRRQHPLPLGLLALLGPEHDEVEDREHRTEQDQRLHEGGRPPGTAGRRGGGVREIGGVRKIHRESGLRTFGFIGRNNHG
jgi:hypothetical protein